MTKNTNTREWKDTPVNPLRKVEYRKKTPVSPTVNDDTTNREWRLTMENPPLNAEIEPPGAVGGMVQEIKPVKQLSFIPTQGDKATDYNSEYM